MNRILLTLAATLCLSAAANAQQLQQANYNDGKIIAFIEQTTSTRSGQRKKADRLVIKNISSSAITVDYQYKALRYDMNDNYQTEQVRHVTTPPIQPGQQWHEAGYISYNHLRGYYFVESFAILNVSRGGGTSSSPSNYGSTQSGGVPSWLIGTWNPGNFSFRISDNQIQWHDGDIGDFVIVEGGNIFFKWRNNGETAKITQIHADRILYQNSSSGATYTADRIR